MSAPILWQWDGEHMRPARRFVTQANRELVVGQYYLMEPVDEAQSARDRAYHAAIRDAWMNLPEDLAIQFASPNDFRHWLLIECGFYDVARISCASSKAAHDAMRFLHAPGAQVAIVGSAVVVKKPWSQSLRGGMKKEERLRSYQETQDLAASLIKVSPDDLRRHGGQAA